MNCASAICASSTRWRARPPSPWSISARCRSASPNSPRRLRKSLPHIAVMQGLDRAVGAIKSLIDYASLRKVVPDIVSSSSASARATLEKTLKNATGAALDEVASKKLLKAYGIPVSKEAIAQTAADAVKIGEENRLSRRRQGRQRGDPAQIRHRRRGAEPQQCRRSQEGVQRHHRAGEETEGQAEARGHPDRATGQGRARAGGRRRARCRNGSGGAVRNRRRRYRTDEGRRPGRRAARCG